MTGPEAEQTRDGPKHSTPAGIAAASAAVFVWGLGNTIIASVPLPGVMISFLRLGFGSLLYTAVLYGTGKRLRRATFRLGAAGGVAFGINLISFFVALRLTSVASATTISALQPLMIMAFAAAMFGEKIRAQHALSAVAALAGVAMVTFGAASGSPRSMVGDAMAVIALFAWVWYFIASKKAREELDTLEYMTVVNIVAFVIVVPVAFVAGDLIGQAPEIDLRIIALIWVIVLVPGSGHLLMNWAHNHTTLLFSSLITLGLPVIATLSAALFLDQKVTAVQVAGIAVVLVSLAVAILGEGRQAVPVEPTE